MSARLYRTTLSLRPAQSADADGGGVAVLATQVALDPGEVEPELAGVLRLEAAYLELDHDEAGLGPVEEQQVDVEVVAVDFEVVLPADEREAVAELEQERLEPRDQGVLEVTFGGGLGEVEEVQDVGVAGELLGELAVGGGELGGEVGWGGPDPMVQVGGDVVGEDVAGPAVFEGRGGAAVRRVRRRRTRTGRRGRRRPVRVRRPGVPIARAGRWSGGCRPGTAGGSRRASRRPQGARPRPSARLCSGWFGCAAGPRARGGPRAPALVADAAQSTALQVRHATGVEGHLPTPGATVVRAGRGSRGRWWRSPSTRCGCGTWPVTLLKSPGAASARIRWTPRSACSPNH